MSVNGCSSVGIVGAGIQGVCIGLQLLKKNIPTTIFDRNDPGMMASYGNAGHFSPYAVLQLNRPDIRVRVSFVHCQTNSHERDEFIHKWKEKVNVVAIQSMIDMSVFENPIPKPALFSTNTSCLCSSRYFTEFGVRDTLYSRVFISFGIPIRMHPIHLIYLTLEIMDKPLRTIIILIKHDTTTVYYS